MKTSTTVIIIIGAVVVVLGGLLVLGAAASTTYGEVEYSYKMEVADSFVGIDGEIETPKAGQQFVILTYHIYNRTCPDPISTNPFTWQMKVILDDVYYTWSSWYTYDHPGYRLIEIPKSTDGTCVQVFTVPAGHTVDEMGIYLDVLFTHTKITYNPALPV